jgi:hypothetical protein
VRYRYDLGVAYRQKQAGLVYGPSPCGKLEECAFEPRNVYIMTHEAGA